MYSCKAGIVVSNLSQFGFLGYETQVVNKNLVLRGITIKIPYIQMLKKFSLKLNLFSGR